MFSNLLKRIFGESPPESGFKVFGDRLWLAFYSNNFKDLENEIIASKAHERFVDRVNLGIVPMPELWYWHLAGSRHGQAKMVGMEGHVVWAIGEFDDSPAGAAAAKFYAETPHKLSHGFTYPKYAFKGGVYYDINTFEISVLPMDVAVPANPFTDYQVYDKEEQMNETQRKKIQETFGSAADDLIQSIEEHGQAAEAIREIAEFKDFGRRTDDMDDDGSADKSATADLLAELFGGQAELTEALAETAQRSTEATSRVSDVLDRLEKRLGVIEKAVKRLVDTRPASVTDTNEGGAKDADESDADVTPADADKQIKDQTEGSEEYDSFFPGLNFPKRS